MGKDFGLPPPGDGSDHQWDVIYCRPHTPCDVTVLDEHITGYAVHWVEFESIEAGKKCLRRRTRLCTAPMGCTWCPLAPPAVWVGYLACFWHREKKGAILLVSPDAGRQLVAREKPFVGLRGQRIVVSREHDRPKGRMLVGSSPLEAISPLPDAFDLGPTLRVLFGTPRLPNEISEGSDPFDAAPIPLPSPIDDRLPWEKGGAS